VAEFRAVTKAAANGCKATIQADGWMGVNHHHLIAFMITVDEKVCCYFKLVQPQYLYIMPDSHSKNLYDASAEHKTAEQLMVLLEEAITTVQYDWGAIVVAIITDALGECCKV
jgi:hypothetical protein